MSSYTLLIIDDADNLLGLRHDLEHHPEYRIIHKKSIENIPILLQQNNIFAMFIRWELVNDIGAYWIEQLRLETHLPLMPIFVVANSLNQQEHLNIFYCEATEWFIRPFLSEALFARLSTYLIQSFTPDGQVKRIEHAQTFSEFYDSLNDLDPAVLCQKLLDFSNQILGIQWVSIWWYDKHNETLVLGQHSSPGFPIKTVKKGESKM